jgi:hypothetical protein
LVGAGRCHGAEVLVTELLFQDSAPTLQPRQGVGR